MRLVHRIIGRQRQNGPDQHRKQDLDCLEISVMFGRSAPLRFGIFLIRLSIYQGSDVSPYTSNYRVRNAKRARSTAGTGARLSGYISYFWSPRAISFRDFPDQCKHLLGGFFFALYFELLEAEGETGHVDRGARNATV